MLRAFIVALGGIVGLICGAVVISVEWPAAYQRRLGDLLTFVAHPIAVALSALTGWPLQQEAGLAIQVLSVFVLFALTGMIAAGLATRRRPRHRR